MSFSLDQVSPRPKTIAIVTGANTGLGYETALGLAKKQITVVMACRHQQKAERAKADILSELPDADLEIMILDLASMASIRSFANHFKSKFDKLDLLINNAGVMVPPYQKTEDGFELQFGVNYLGHFLLTALLIDQMPDRPESRVVSLASNAHKRGKIHFEDLQWEQEYSRQDAYAQSKLACLLFGDELDRRLKAEGKTIRSVSAHPGVSLTDLGRHIPSLLYGLLKYTVAPFFTHSPEKGALPTLKAALDTGVEGGEYFGPQGFREMTGEPGLASRAEAAKDEQTASKLWKVSEELTDCTFSF